MKAPTPNRRLVLLAAPSITLAACSDIIGPLPSSQMYSLSAPADRPDSGPKVGWSLAIVKPETSELLDTNRIALASSGSEFDYYSNAVWTDHLPDLIQTRLLSAFEASGRISVVVREEDGFRGDYKLLTDIRDFEARYPASKTEPPTVAVTIVAHAVDIRSRKVAASTTAALTQACTANNVNSVVEAFDIALDKTMARIVDWAFNLPAPETLPVPG
jgi:cholesterol transport system auxiliary component